MHQMRITKCCECELQKKLFDYAPYCSHPKWKPVESMTTLKTAADKRKFRALQAIKNGEIPCPEFVKKEKRV